MSTSTLTETPVKQLRKSTDEGQRLQQLREDAGLSREELGRRKALVAQYGPRGNEWACTFEESLPLFVKDVFLAERSRVRTPRSLTVATLTTLIDAGPAGTSDRDVLDHWSAYVDECAADETVALTAIGREFARTMDPAFDTMANIIKRFVTFTAEIGHHESPYRRWLDDPRYIEDIPGTIIAGVVLELVGNTKASV